MEGVEGGFTPFNRGSLPVVSGITMEVKENKGAYTLTKVLKNGKAIKDDEPFSVTCLATNADFPQLDLRFKVKISHKAIAQLLFFCFFLPYCRIDKDKQTRHSLC